MRLLQRLAGRGGSGQSFGNFGAIPPFKDESWLDYSYYSKDDVWWDSQLPA